MQRQWQRLLPQLQAPPSTLPVPRACAETLHRLATGFSQAPFTPSFMLCGRAGSVFGDGSHDAVQDSRSGTHPEQSSVLECNIKSRVQGWRRCFSRSDAGFLPHTGCVGVVGCSSKATSSPGRARLAPLWVARATSAIARATAGLTNTIRIVSCP